MSGALGHLGERAAALVDGQLGPVEHERAVAHLARCPACRTEVEEQRRLKARLDDLSGLSAPAGLESRLRALGAAPAGGAAPWPPAGPGPAWPPGPGGGPAWLPPDVRGGTGPVGTATPAAGSTAPARPSGRSRPVLAVAGGGLLAGAGALVLLATTGEPVPSVDPGAPRLVVEHVSTTTQVPLTDPVPGAALGVRGGAGGR